MRGLTTLTALSAGVFYSNAEQWKRRDQMTSNPLFLRAGVRWWANRLFPLLLCPSTGKQSKRTIQSLCEGKTNNASTVDETALAKGVRYEAGKCSRREVRPGG